MRYELDSGEWFVPGKGFRLACCSCSLIHDVEFRQRNGKLEMKIIRNERATVAMRRKRRKKVIIVTEED